MCDDIRDNSAYKTEEEKKEALLRYYLHTMPLASWPSVAIALHSREEETALRAAKDFLEDPPTGQLS